MLYILYTLHIIIIITMYTVQYIYHWTPCVEPMNSTTELRCLDLNLFITLSPEFRCLDLFVYYFITFRCLDLFVYYFITRISLPWFICLLLYHQNFVALIYLFITLCSNWFGLLPWFICLLLYVAICSSKINIIKPRVCILTQAFVRLCEIQKITAASIMWNEFISLSLFSLKSNKNKWNCSFKLSLTTISN